jgi:glycine betaine catabolism B
MVMVDALVAYMRNTPMYRSMLYFLLALLWLAAGLSFIGVLPYSPLDILLTGLYLTTIGWAGSWGLGKLLGAKPNPESSVITALILALIFGPMPLADNILALTFVGLAAVSSKYLLVWRQSHVFNPAALGAVAGALVLGVGATWWVASIYLLPLVLIGGLYEAYKANRLHLALSFLVAYAVFFVVRVLLGGADIASALDTLWMLLLHSPILFFVFVMLIEPLTSPAERSKRIYYGVLTAMLAVGLPWALPGVPYTLELSLLLGNLFAILSGNQGRLLLTLKRKEQLAPNIIGFWFNPSHDRHFQPGQFLHYTLPHRRSDMRGSRRFFTIASSPTESDILLVTKFAERSSSFKSALQAMSTGDEIAATRPEGEFVLPDDDKRPLVFIAGGIGVTPYRSIIKHLVDTKQKRPVTLIYGAKTGQELVFRDLFDSAEESIGLKNVYVLDEPPRSWKGEKGPLTAELIKKHSPDAKEALFYLSGPEPMVRSLISQLQDAGVPTKNIKRDYFPGY